MRTKRILGMTFVVVVSAFVFIYATKTFAEPPVSGGERGSLLMRLDKDGDGQISKEEYLAKHNERFESLDENNDGYIDENEAITARRQPGAHGFIKKFDKDNDGKVSKEEFSGPDEKFDGLDENQDGYIDNSEAVGARPVPRKKAGRR